MLVSGAWWSKSRVIHARTDCDMTDCIQFWAQGSSKIVEGSSSIFLYEFHSGTDSSIELWMLNFSKQFLKKIDEGHFVSHAMPALYLTGYMQDPDPELTNEWSTVYFRQGGDDYKGRALLTIRGTTIQSSCWCALSHIQHVSLQKQLDHHLLSSVTIRNSKVVLATAKDQMDGVANWTVCKTEATFHVKCQAHGGFVIYFQWIKWISASVEITSCQM